jgi:hypothetical protein
MKTNREWTRIYANKRPFDPQITQITQINFVGIDHAGDLWKAFRQYQWF